MLANPLWWSPGGRSIIGRVCSHLLPARLPVTAAAAARSAGGVARGAAPGGVSLFSFVHFWPADARSPPPLGGGWSLASGVVGSGPRSAESWVRNTRGFVDARRLLLLPVLARSVCVSCLWCSLERNETRVFRPSSRPPVAIGSARPRPQNSPRDTFVSLVDLGHPGRLASAPAVRQLSSSRPACGFTGDAGEPVAPDIRASRAGLNLSSCSPWVASVLAAESGHPGRRDRGRPGRGR